MKKIFFLIAFVIATLSGNAQSFGIKLGYTPTKNYQVNYKPASFNKYNNRNAVGISMSIELPKSGDVKVKIEPYKKQDELYELPPLPVKMSNPVKNPN